MAPGPSSWNADQAILALFVGLSRNRLQPVRQFPAAGVVDDVLTHQLPDHLGWSQVVGRANLLEDRLLPGIDEDGQSGSPVFHCAFSPIPADLVVGVNNINI